MTPSSSSKHDPVPPASETHAIKEPTELQRIYEHRFRPETIRYRQTLWQTLVNDYFQRLLPPEAAVLDLGCGYGEFINSIRCREKFGMDLNPEASARVASDVHLLHQDCSREWALPDDRLDVVFTSNFFEHLPDKLALRQTLRQALRCLKPNGRLIALGPNIKFVPGEYWDFWDHFLCLTEKSLAEAMLNNGFRIIRALPRFLPYSTVDAPRYPMTLVRLYLRLPIVWRIFGRQFLVIAEKPTGR